MKENTQERSSTFCPPSSSEDVYAMMITNLTNFNNTQEGTLRLHQQQPPSSRISLLSASFERRLMSVQLRTRREGSATTIVQQEEEPRRQNRAECRTINHDSCQQLDDCGRATGNDDYIVTPCGGSTSTTRVGRSSNRRVLFKAIDTVLLICEADTISSEIEESITAIMEEKGF